MTASRVSHSISSKGCTPSFVKYRLKARPPAFVSRSRAFVATVALLPLRGRTVAPAHGWGKPVENHKDVILHPAPPGCQGDHREILPDVVHILGIGRRDHNMWYGCVSGASSGWPPVSATASRPPAR